MSGIVLNILGLSTATVWTASRGATQLGPLVFLDSSTITSIPTDVDLFIPLDVTSTTTIDVAAVATKLRSLVLTGSSYNAAQTTSITSTVSASTTRHAFGPASNSQVAAINSAPNIAVAPGERIFLPVAMLPPTTVLVNVLAYQLRENFTALLAATSSATPGFAPDPGNASVSNVVISSATASTDPGASNTSPEMISETSHDVPTGALAGGIVAAVLIGLLLGAIIGILCLKRKQKRARRSTSSMEQELKPMTFVGNGSTRSRLSLAPAALVGWKKHIPQEQSEKDLTSSLTSINHHIEMYVAAFYGSRQANVTAGQLASLSAIADVETMKCAKAAQKPESILEKVIAAFLISRVSFRSDNNDSLLPADLSTIPKRLGLNLESRDIGPRAYTERSGFLAAVAEWRVLTAFLTTDVDPRAQQKLDTKVENTVKLLIAGLSSFEDEQHDSSSRERELRKIVVNVAAAGQALFRQPSTFVFDWTDHSHSIEPSIITFPALVKTMEENGHRLDKPKTVLPAKLKRI